MSFPKELTPKLIANVAIICIGSLQFGYHMAELNSPESVISCRISKPNPLVPYAESWFGSHGFEMCISMTAEQVGTITSIFSLGGLLGSFFVGSIADKIGRKRTGLLHCGIYLVGSTLNGIANTYTAILVGRFVAGLGAGAALAIGPVFINEIAPAKVKGFLGSMNQVSVNIGILITQFLALIWCDNNNWRLLLLTGSVLAIFNFVAIFFYVDESPMWLYNNGFTSKAYQVLHDIRGGEYVQAREEVNSWKSHVSGTSSNESDDLLQEEGAAAPAVAYSSQPSITLSTYLSSPEYFNSRLVSTGILIAQQFCGINSIIFYGVSVLISVFPDYAILINCLISIVNVVVTFGSAPLIDKLGRKPLLLGSVTVMGISSSIMGFGIISSSAILSIVGTFTYITAFATGLGPIPFLLVSEVTQPKVKAVAQSWGTACNWFATGLVGLLFPILKNSWIGGGVYFIFTAFCALTYLFIKRYIPETKGLSTYEEVWGQRID
ncbi:probable metabolite transport protein [[Candida] railenensis]|uniref:Probable metabolite transport protein n=1 Tax=[Candida] railenensis TaxID=45579 RepID=A0A9P0VVP3_9ASCO|nr:probable metabolite transport protein [[Candida] railenensis]